MPSPLPLPPEPGQAPDQEPDQEPGPEPCGAGSGRRAALAGGPAVWGQVLAEKMSRLNGWIRRRSFSQVLAGAAAVLAVGLLAWWLSASLGGGSVPSAAQSPAAPAAASPAPASRGALPLEGVSPLDFQLGDCFKDFDPDAPQSHVVACDTAHSAQLVAIERYAPADSYPGRETLKQKALDICKGAALTAKSSGYDLSYRLAYPSSNSWGTGDRRVDCFVVAATGNVIMESLLPAP